MTPECVKCNEDMEYDRTIRRSMGTMKITAIHVYKCWQCRDEYHKRGSETIA